MNCRIILGALFTLECLSMTSRVCAADIARREVHIEPQALAPALRTFAKDRGVQLVYRSELVERQRTRGATGDLTVDEALDELLEGTGLRFVYLEESAVTIVAAQGDRVAPDSPTLRLDPGPSITGSSASPAEVEQLEDNITPVRLAEVVVSAQKRLENLQDVPVPVTVLEANVLAREGKVRLADFYSSVPGLDFTAGGAFGGAQQTISIRGLTTTTLSNTTVAVLIDDVPFGSSTFLGLGSVSYPDIDPAILSRIEVLRGPQGTLYGASSIGGVIKYVTVDPSLDQLTGQGRVGTEFVDRGEAGYDTSVAVSIPLAPSIGVQASGFSRREPGYVKNIASGERDVNETDIGGGRLAGLWQVSEGLSLKVSALFQTTIGEGTPAVDTQLNLRPVFGDLTQSRMPGTERYRINDGLYTATLTAHLGGIELASISGFGTIRYNHNPDSSLISLSATEALFGVDGASQLGSYVRTHRLTQELRVASALSSRFDWIGGLFFNHEQSRYLSVLNANDLTSGAFVGTMAKYDTRSQLNEYSAFGDLTVHFTDRFDVQVGGRQAQIHQRYDETDTGPLVEYFGQPSPNVVPTEKSDGHAFTYLVTPRFRVNESVMAFTRFASGYRPGGPNVNAEVSDNPLSFEPDKTYSYEMGFKGRLLEGALDFDFSAYYIDWKNIQIQLDNYATFSSYIANVGDARSTGAEISLQARPRRGLTLGAAIAVDDAVLTSNVPTSASAIGFRGDRLPYSSAFTATVSADQDLILSSHLTGFAGASLSYVGDRQGEFATTAEPTRLTFPAYASFDLRTGLHYDKWSLDLFCRNVADRRGIVGGLAPAAAGTGVNVIYIQPRTLGMSLSRSL
jgi:iron complex outermembrane recepter protein